LKCRCGPDLDDNPGAHHPLQGGSTLNRFQPPPLADHQRHHLNYLRVSITDRCNLRCLYCSPHGLIPKLSHDDILTYEEILRLVTLSTHLGIKKVRITGGEPLVRKGVCDFLQRLTRIEKLQDVSLTTNGVLLKDRLAEIQAAGIRRINISLDTLQKDTYKLITGYDLFDQVWAGIETARAQGLAPIKINVVALKGYNDNELEAFGRLSIDHPYHVRFIEYMPIGRSALPAGEHLLTDEIKARLSKLGTLSRIDPAALDGPAERYRFNGARGEIGFIRPISRHFCEHCNRLRLTANGQLRPCLLSDRQLDLKTPLRQGATDAQLADIFIQATRYKSDGPKLGTAARPQVQSPMSGIGG
jgi:cyclic pyranopterin phosphate synthase